MAVRSDAESVPEIKLTEPEEAVEAEKSSSGTTQPNDASQPAPAGRRRQKVPLAPGHTLGHWHALVSSRQKSYPTARISPKELAKHKSEDDAWVSLNGKVFDVTRYLSFHPGGVPKLMLAAGKDATALFQKYHAWVNYESLLAADCIGYLMPDEDEE